MRYKGRYCVMRYDKDGKRVVSGMGRHAGRWDYDHSYGRACAHARQLRKQFPGAVFKVEPVT